MIVEGEVLSMTRGDTESITVSITNRPFTTGDKIEMTVRKRADSEDVCFHKTVTSFQQNGSAVIPINPTDTNKMSFGKYVYDIQWTDQNGNICTIIKPTKNNFILTDEVTYS